jgi:hypothetical protein
LLRLARVSTKAKIEASVKIAYQYIQPTTISSTTTQKKEFHQNEERTGFLKTMSNLQKVGARSPRTSSAPMDKRRRSFGGA